MTIVDPVRGLYLALLILYGAGISICTLGKETTSVSESFIIIDIEYINILYGVMHQMGILAAMLIIS